MEEIFLSIKPEVLTHSAASVNSIPSPDQHSNDVYLVNVKVTKNIFR